MLFFDPRDHPKGEFREELKNDKGEVVGWYGRYANGMTYLTSKEYADRLEEIIAKNPDGLQGFIKGLKKPSNGQ